MPLPRRGEGGIALVVALVFLLVLTILGVTAMQTATLQERMAGNARDRTLALQAAEFALRDAEALLAGGVTNGSQFHDLEDAPDWTALNCPSGDTQTVNIPNAALATDPCYFIEPFNEGTSLVPGEEVPPGTIVYRITAVATGQSPDSRVVLRSSYRP